VPIIRKYSEDEWAEIVREVRATAPPFEPPRLFSAVDEMLTARKRRRKRTQRDQGDRIEVIK